MYARALVDLHVGRAELGIGEGDHAVVRRGRRDLLGAKGAADPGVGVGGGDLAETGPQRADARRVLGQRPPVGGAQRVLEERVGVDRQDDAAGDLEVGRPRPLDPEQRRRGRPLGGLAGPVHRRFRRVAPGGGTGVHRLGPRDEDDPEVAPGDGPAGVVHAAPAARCRRRRSASSSGGMESASKPSLAPTRRAGLTERQPSGTTTRMLSARRIRASPAAAGPPGAAPAASSAAARRARTINSTGSGRSAGSVSGSGRSGDLTDPDDDRGGGMEGHVPGIVPADAPGSPCPLGRLGLHARRLRLGPCRVLPQGDPQGRARRAGP